MTKEEAFTGNLVLIQTTSRLFRLFTLFFPKARFTSSAAGHTILSEFALIGKKFYVRRIWLVQDIPEVIDESYIESMNYDVQVMAPEGTA